MMDAMLEYAGLLLLDVPKVAEKVLPDEPWRLGPGLPTHWRVRLALEHMKTSAGWAAEVVKVFAFIADMVVKSMARWTEAAGECNERMWEAQAEMN